MMFARSLCISLLLSSFMCLDALAATNHKLLLISFDGFRWDYASRTPDMEAFSYLRDNGVTAEYLQPVFPTQTSPNHFSIATGLYVESHGVVHNVYYNFSEPVRDTFYTTLAKNDWWDNGGEPIWITAVNQGLKSGGYMFPGSYANISGVGATLRVLETAATPTDEEAWRERIVQTMKWFTEENLDMVALYFEQPDSESHNEGPNSETIANEMMPLLNRTIMYIIEKTKEYGLTDNLNIIITSDHGFETIDTTVTREEAISLGKYIGLDNVTFQLAYGPLGLVEPKPGIVDTIAEQIRDGNPNMKVYLKEEIPERFHYKNNERIPSVVVVAEPGYSVYWQFVFHVNTGEHGYDNELKNMRTSYYSIGPSFKKGYTVGGFDNVNIYPLMCHLLGLTPAPNNGSLDVLYETLDLATPTSSTQATTTPTSSTQATTTPTSSTQTTTPPTSPTQTTISPTQTTTSAAHKINSLRMLILSCSFALLLLKNLSCI